MAARPPTGHLQSRAGRRKSLDPGARHVRNKRVVATLRAYVVEFLVQRCSAIAPIAVCFGYRLQQKGRAVASKTQEQAIRNYLTVLNDPAALHTNDVGALEAQINSTDDPVERLRLRGKIEQLKQPDTSKYEDAFVKHAKAWATEHGVTADAFRAEGVPPAVLRKAGFAVRGDGRKRTRGRRSTATRRTRVNVQQVRKAIPRGKFTVKDVQEASGASPAVVRRVIQEEIQAGNVTDAGPASDHHGPGRAPTIYQRK